MTSPPARDVVLFGDPEGIRQVLEAGGEALLLRISALCTASIRKSQHAHMTQLAEACRVQLLIQPRPADAGYSAFRSRLQQLAPSLGICNSYSMIIRPDVLALFKRGIANLHGAPLPEFRGANPVEWAIIKDETLAGATLHWMDDGVDTGPVIARETTSIGMLDTWRDVRRRVHALTMPLLRQALPSLLSGSALATPQDETTARAFPRRSRGDGTFSWGWPARDIYNLIRALVSPHPGAIPSDGKDAGARLSAYLSPAEVLALKRRNLPTSLQYDRLALQPLTDPIPVRGGHRAPLEIPFLLTHSRASAGREPLGGGVIRLDGWYRGTFTFSMSAAPAIRRQALTLIKNVMSTEFALSPAANYRRSSTW
jgi:methionyl-tRNA formyltransferase